MHPLLTPRHSDLVNKAPWTEPSSPVSPARPASAGTRTAAASTPPSARRDVVATTPTTPDQSRLTMDRYLRVASGKPVASTPPSRAVAQRLLAASAAGGVPPAPPSSPANPAQSLPRVRPGALVRQFIGLRLFQDRDAPPSPFSAPLPRAVKAVRVEESAALPRAITAARAPEPKSAALAAAPEQVLKSMVGKAAKLLEETDGRVLAALPYISLNEFQAATALVSYDTKRAPFAYERDAAAVVFAIAEKKPGTEGYKGVGVERGGTVLGVVTHNAIDCKNLAEGKAPREHQGLIVALRATVTAMVSTGPKREEAMRKAVNQDLIKQLMRGNKEKSGVSGFRFYYLPDTHTVEIDLSHGYKAHRPSAAMKAHYARMMANAILIAAKTPAHELPASMAKFDLNTLKIKSVAVASSDKKSVEPAEKPWMQEVAELVSEQVAAHAPTLSA